MGSDYESWREAEAENEQLQERIARLRAALAIYADDANWNGYRGHPLEYWDPAGRYGDGPAVARAALAADA